MFAWKFAENLLVAVLMLGSLQCTLAGLREGAKGSGSEWQRNTEGEEGNGRVETHTLPIHILDADTTCEVGAVLWTTNRKLLIKMNVQFTQLMQNLHVHLCT